MTEFEKLTVEDVEAIGAADDPEAMDRNARAAAHLWGAYEYAKNSFSSHFTELRRYWTGAVATRFADEAQVVRDDVDEMGTVLQAHTDALPMVAETMRRLKTDSKALADEYRGKRAEYEGQPPQTALPAIQKLDREYAEKSRLRLIEANNTYHQYNNGYLAPPQEFRGVLPDSAQPQLQSAPSLPTAPPVPTAAPPAPAVVANPPMTGVLPPMVGLPPRPMVPPPLSPRSLVGTPGLGVVRNPPAAMLRNTMVANPSVTPRAVPRTGVASTIPAHPRPAVVRPVTTPVTGPRPGVVARPPVAARPLVPPRTLTSPLVAAGRTAPAVRVTTGTAAVKTQWTRSPLVRATNAPTVATKPSAPAPQPTPQWTRAPFVPAPEPVVTTPAEPAPGQARQPQPAWGRTPWVRPAHGSAVYPAHSQPPPAPEPESEPGSEADEPLLNPVTLSRLLAEATPTDRERLLAIETAKLERIQAAAREPKPPET